MTPRLTNSHFLTKLALVVALATASVHAAPGEEYEEHFDESKVTGRVRYDAAQTRLVQHRRHPHLVAKGTGAEYFLFESGTAGGAATVEFTIPAARAIDDFSLTVAIRSNRTGINPALRVVLPHERDRETGEPLEMLVPATQYQKSGVWQNIRCTVQEKQIRERLTLLRAALSNSGLNSKDLYVDRLILAIEIPPGAMEVIVDELKCGPIINPRSEIAVAAGEETTAQEKRSVEFRLDRLHVEGRPFFPRMVAWHEESLESLRDAGINVVWIPSDADPSLLNQLREMNLWAAATPPQATDDEGLPLPAREAAMVPFTDATAPILFWNLGTRIPPSAKEDVANWIEQINNADRRLARPVMLDVSGLERVYSRLAPMLGVSRHVLHTSFSTKDYRNWLAQRRKLARPGSFTWTWIQTEAAPAHSDWRSSGLHHPVVVEPEQIRLQAYAALAGGCRGLGFWKTNKLDEEAPGNAERRHVLTQLDLELELLGPWLATGNVVAHVPFEVKLKSTLKVSQRNLDFRTSEPDLQERDALLRVRDDELKRQDQVRDELEATIIRSDYGVLLLPIWYERDSQFAPGQMAANEATIVVPGIDESATVWEVSTTGLRSLKRERVAGGTKITLPKFDQTAAIIITADRNVVSDLKQKIDLMASRSADAMVKLAHAKRERTLSINEELGSLGLTQPDSAQLLSQSEVLQREAESALQGRDFRTAREKAESSMQLLRILQRAHWNDAIRNLSAPLASPHTICFQTLPDHWRMIGQVGRSAHGETNLLRSGDFEDVDTMVVEGWKHSQRAPEGVKTKVELFPSSQQGKYSLRLLAAAEKPPASDQGKDSEKNREQTPLAPLVLPEAPVIVTTPQVTVRAGQIVHISGWIRIVTPVTASLDGVMIYENTLGTAGAVRWHQTTGWQRFEILREVRESGPLAITFALTGLGEVNLDDVKVVPHAPRGENDPPADIASEAMPDRGSRSLLNRLPRFPRMNPRRSGYNPTTEPGRISSAPEGDVQRQ